jgi:pimeloyl-ACP methyl ester carboxylesterase
VEQFGSSGPVLVLVHGGGRLGKHYRELAKALSARFQVVTYDRRGHGGSSPLRADHSAGSEAEDLKQLLQHTGARLVFGHSAGAIVTLETALITPTITKLAVYEPPVAFERFAPFDWWPDFLRALEEKNEARAFALFTSKLDFGPPQWLPIWALTLGVKVLMRGEQGAELAALMHTVPGDLAIARCIGADVERYRALSMPVQLMSGTDSPRFIHQGLALLEPCVPRLTQLRMPKQGHNAPDLTGVDETTKALLEWFAA